VNAVDGPAVGRGGDHIYLSVSLFASIQPCFHMLVQRGLFWLGLKLVCAARQRLETPPIPFWPGLLHWSIVLVQFVSSREILRAPRDTGRHRRASCSLLCPRADKLRAGSRPPIETAQGYIYIYIYIHIYKYAVTTRPINGKTDASTQQGHDRAGNFGFIDAANHASINATR
jgi:hypothetical protein